MKKSAPDEFRKAFRNHIEVCDFDERAKQRISSRKLSRTINTIAAEAQLGVDGGAPPQVVEVEAACVTTSIEKIRSVCSRKVRMSRVSVNYKADFPYFEIV